MTHLLSEGASLQGTGWDKPQESGGPGWGPAHASPVCGTGWALGPGQQDVSAGASLTLTDLSALLSGEDSQSTARSKASGYLCPSNPPAELSDTSGLRLTYLLFPHKPPRTCHPVSRAA